MIRRLETEVEPLDPVNSELRVKAGSIAKQYSKIVASGEIIVAGERVTLARGRQARISYEVGQAPFVASRLQDFFGMREGPKVAAGRPCSAAA